MSDGKGKGRSNDFDDNENGQTASLTTQSPSTILNRITSSATGLARSTLGAPNSSEIANHESAAAGRAGKSEGVGRSNNSAWAESSGASQRHTTSVLQSQAIPSIRAGHTEDHILKNEAEFSSFLEGIDSFKPLTEARLETEHARRPPPVGLLAGLDFRIDATNDLYDQSRYSSVEEQQRHDGEDVLAILSNPSALNDQLEPLPLEDEVAYWGLTGQQMLALKPVIDELFPPAEPHISPRPDHLLNLIPNMASNQVNPLPIQLADTIQAQHTINSSRRAVEESMRETWIKQWEDVLTRYADEVWGNLRPLIVEARQEVQAIKTHPRGTQDEQPKALRRLQLVLNQLRKQ